MIQTRRVRDPRAEKLDEAQNASIQHSEDMGERTGALLEYVAMMCDVELPTDEEGDDE